MTFEEISENAYKKQEISNLCNLAEKYAYLKLKNLYRDYSNEMITKDEAKSQKLKIKKEFENNQREIDEYYEYLKKQSEIRSKYTNILVSIEKSQDIEEILDNSLKYIELIIQDFSFYDRNIKKINCNKK